MALRWGETSDPDVVTALRFDLATGSPVTLSDSGTLYTPESGQRIRLRWLGLATPPGQGNVVATVKIGTTEIYKWPLGSPGIFSHSSRREGGADEALTVTLDNAQTVYANFDLEEF